MTRAVATVLVLLAACSTELPPPSTGGTSGDTWMPAGTEQRWREVVDRVRTTFADVEHVTVPELLAERRAGRTPLLVDVRTDAEWRVSHLPGARHAPAPDPVAALGDVARDTPIVTYCSVGWRSAEAARALRRAGFTRVRNLIGSAFEWANRGLPLENDAGPTGIVHPFDASWGALVAPEHRGQ